LESLGLVLYFAKDYEVQGEVKTFELKPGGKDILVTEENKEEFIE
jgi:atrophin-1 interacting protein 5 (WW domain-containing E3 ubiquitin protein ligase 1)